MCPNHLKSAAAALLAVSLLGLVAHAADPKDVPAPSAASPDSRLVAIADDKSISIVDGATGKILAKMQGHTDKVTALTFSPDGKLLASGGNDKMVCLWDIPTGRQVLKIEGKDAIVSLTFSKEGKTLTAKEGEKNKRTWDVATGKEVP